MVWFSRRNPTTVSGRVLIPRASGADKPSHRAPRERSEQRGCKNHYKFVLGAGAKVEERSDEIPPGRGKKHDNLSRTAENNLPILSVLACVIFFQILCPLFIKDKNENSSNQESW